MEIFKQPRVFCVFSFFFLITLLFFVYWEVPSHDFINFDDPVYVTDNSFVKEGITLNGIAWAFGIHGDICMYWQPVAWIAHMIDCELWGMDAGKHHLNDSILHFLNVFLLFFLLIKTTQKKRASLLVAALFAIHPINVNPVCWVAEKKTLVAAFFWFLALISYFYYQKKKSFWPLSSLRLVFLAGDAIKASNDNLPLCIDPF